MMSPGTYLRLRREAAGFPTIHTLASFIAGAAPRMMRPFEERRVMMTFALERAEGDREMLTNWQAGNLIPFFAFDPEVYQKLALLHADGPSSMLPVPQVCRDCGCSWFDPCTTDTCTCEWSAADPELCTACEAKADHRHRHHHPHPAAPAAQRQPMERAL